MLTKKNQMQYMYTGLVYNHIMYCTFTFLSLPKIVWKKERGEYGRWQIVINLSKVYRKINSCKIYIFESDLDWRMQLMIEGKGGLIDIYCNKHNVTLIVPLL